MRTYLSLAVFLVVVAGGGLTIGLLTLPGEWYSLLAKPAFNPPDWIFGPVWTLLYILVAVAGWRTWLRDPGGMAMRIWAAQLVLNFAWSPVFFGAHMPLPALFVIVALLATILLFIARSAADGDCVAAWLFAPYALWVAFATLLNASIVALN